MSTGATGRVALIGCGGLGGPIAYALAAAGASLTLCDHDLVELSNLQRQVQFTSADLGEPKARALAAELGRRGHAADRVRALERRFDAGSADEVLDGAALVIDGSDDFATKFEVSDQAVRRGLPAVIAAVWRYEGQVLRVVPGGACYRCLFEAPPPAEDAASCADAGVLGAAVAAIAGRAARAALDLLGGRPGPTLEVLSDLATGRPARAIELRPRIECPACGARRARPRYDLRPGRPHTRPSTHSTR